MLEPKNHIISQLQREIFLLEGFKPGNIINPAIELGPLINAFPNNTFPLGAIHEFLLSGAESIAATSGFVSGLLSGLMKGGGISLWISTSRTLFPPALKNFGISPDQFIFIDLQKEKDLLYIMEEALKCPALTAVVGELRDISFTASRRLQLAVEKSQVTGFVLHGSSPNTTACLSRWKITSLPSYVFKDLPGVGFPQWKVDLLRIRNGRTGHWQLKWEKGKFHHIHTPTLELPEQQKKTG
jgi:protein ImuA